MDNIYFRSLPIKSVNQEGKNYLIQNYSLYFNHENILQLNEEYFQLKVIRLLDYSIHDLNKKSIKKHINQIRLDKYDFIFLMLIFKDQIIFCNIPINYLEQLSLSHQHNEECLQTEILINEIITLFQIDPKFLQKVS